MWFHKEHHEPLIPIREILFSGGDPLTLPNSTLARYMSLMAEAGIRTIRFGTKELAFNPQRLDQDFWSMIDLFHENYPEVRMEIVGHYVHPFELVEARTNEDGEYLYDINQIYKVREDLAPVLENINKRRGYVGHFNQFPIIAGVNDSPEILRLLIYQSNRLGISVHNIYACREIIGNKHFRQENTIERQYKLIEKAKTGLSGIENHARLIMSLEYGKTEVVAVKNKKVFVKFNRYIHGHRPDDIVIEIDTKKLSEGFYWLTDEVIKTAIDDERRKTLEDLAKEDDSLIKNFKKTAARKVMQDKESLTKEPKEQRSSAKSFSNTVIIEVLDRNSGSKFIYVDVEKEKSKKRNPTLATILSKEGIVEAACKEQLSCSTCVGHVKIEELEADEIIETEIEEFKFDETKESKERKDKKQQIVKSWKDKPDEDEIDLIDSVTKDLPSSTVKNIRAACRIALRGGEKIIFTSLAELSRRENKDKNDGSRF